MFFAYFLPDCEMSTRKRSKSIELKFNQKKSIVPTEHLLEFVEKLMKKFLQLTQDFLYLKEFCTEFCVYLTDNEFDSTKPSVDNIRKHFIDCYDDCQNKLSVTKIDLLKMILGINSFFRIKLILFY